MHGIRLTLSCVGLHPELSVFNLVFEFFFLFCVALHVLPLRFLVELEGSVDILFGLQNDIRHFFLYFFHLDDTVFDIFKMSDPLRKVFHLTFQMKLIACLFLLIFSKKTFLLHQTFVDVLTEKGHVFRYRLKLGDYSLILNNLFFNIYYFLVSLSYFGMSLVNTFLEMSDHISHHFT